jgi:uncharacterized protein (TIGR02996 family)
MSGSLAQGFLADIVANIDDDTPRLVYADWLSENGQDDRAEFIRVQVERARRPAWDAAQVRLRLREQELLTRHGEEWLAELPAIEGAKWEGFRRGIIAEVSFASFEAMRQSAHACRAVAPVEAISVHWPRKREGAPDSTPVAELRELSLTGKPRSETEIAWLADSPQLSTLRCLTAHGLWAEGLGRLVASPHLARLRALHLPANNLGNAGILALIRAVALTGLEELDLSGRGVAQRYHDDPIVRSPGMEALAGWTGLATVRSLTLSSNDVGRPGLRALLRSKNAAALKELSLRGGRLDGQAMAELADAQPGPRLERLDLGENVLKELGAEYVALAPCLRELKVLRLDRCEIPLSGARRMAKKAAFLDGLRLLEVGHNHFGSVGLGALLERQPPSLHALGMRDNDLFDQGAEILAGSPASDTLLEVDLSLNGLGVAAARALGESAYLRQLLVLRLDDNFLGESAIATLSASPLGRRLVILGLGDRPPAPAPPPPGGEDVPSAPDLPPTGKDGIPF